MKVCFALVGEKCGMCLPLNQKKVEEVLFNIYPSMNPQETRTTLLTCGIWWLRCRSETERSIHPLNMHLYSLPKFTVSIFKNLGVHKWEELEAHESCEGIMQRSRKHSNTLAVRQAQLGLKHQHCPFSHICQIGKQHKTQVRAKVPFIMTERHTWVYSQQE